MYTGYKMILCCNVLTEDFRHMKLLTPHFTWAEKKEITDYFP